jgi:hypothetical protein
MRKEKTMRVSFGVMVNDPPRLNMVLRQSSLPGELNYVANPESATKGLNQLLDIMKESDIAVLTHQDMYYRQGWLEKMKEQIKQLPDSWVVAGILGKDVQGQICGHMHDMRRVQHFNTYYTSPQEACCLDECCLIVNMKKNFRFDECLDGFDLYGSLCVHQAWEMGGTAWIIDAFAEHYIMRPFSWFPDKDFERRYKILIRKYGDGVDSTVFRAKPDVRTSGGDYEQKEK